ncbi:MAG: helix-turn-helix transcriptional regulator [Actinomycetota bacterium]
MATNHLAVLGAMLADNTRAEILCTLMDGRAHTGGELAGHIGVGPSTVSEHLSKLQERQMVTVEPQGRHRYFRLASPEIAEMLETLGAACHPIDISPPAAPAALLYARTCYDHLAGELAVQIYDQLLADGRLDHHHGQLVLTPTGEATLSAIGVDIDKARGARRPTVRSCLDWTQRRHHLAGSAAAATLDTFLTQRWITRGPKPRTVNLTDRGRRAIAKHFNLNLNR